MSDIELIDSHCHLIFENFERDLDDVFQDCVQEVLKN